MNLFFFVLKYNISFTSSDGGEQDYKGYPTLEHDISSALSKENGVSVLL